MSKSLVLFGCLFSNVVIFGGICCNNNDSKSKSSTESVDDNKSKSSTESVEIKFKKLVCKYFGVQESDIINVKSADRFESNIGSIFNGNEISNAAFLVVHKMNSKFLYCLLRKNVNPDPNVLNGCVSNEDEGLECLEEGFDVHNLRTNATGYYKLKK